MKKTILLLGVLIIIIVGMFWMGSKNGPNVLVGSGFTQIFNKSTPTPSSTPAPPNAPKTYSFDSQTDLKSELEKVNPEVLDSDFE